MESVLDALIIIGVAACIIALNSGVKYLCRRYIRQRKQCGDQ